MNPERHYVLTMVLAVAVQLIPLHMVDGRTVDINPKTVTRLQEPREADDPSAQGHSAIRCLVWFVDNSYLSVVETCSAVRDLISGR